MALSLNVYQRVHPPVWSYCNLPFNSFKVLPVPKPIGGVLIISVNALLYLNQSVPPYGVSLNSFTDVSTAFPLKQQPGVRIGLDACRCEFLADDRIVFCLKNGEIFVLTLFTDGMRSICKFIFNQAASSVLTSCLTMCEPGYLFLGSRLGNSLLLKYTESDMVEGEEPEDDEPEPPKIETDENGEGEAEGEQGNTTSDGTTEESVQEGEKPTEEVHEERAPAIPTDNNNTSNDNSHDNHENNNDDDEPASKKQKIGSDNIDEWAASNVDFIDDTFELKVYGQKNDEHQSTKLYKFEMADALQNIGPIIRVAMGEPAFQSGLSNKSDNDVEVEVVTVSGHARNGALCVLQRTIKPQVITTFELPGCTDLWTVRSSTSRAADTDKDTHQFLILSRSDSTMVSLFCIVLADAT